MLKNYVIKRLIIKHDVYQRSNPTEIAKFQAILSNNPGYDMVIDGLNVGGVNARSVPRGKMREIGSQILLHILETLDTMGIKPLLFHRQALKTFPDFRRIG